MTVFIKSKITEKEDKFSLRTGKKNNNGIKKGNSFKEMFFMKE